MQDDRDRKTACDDDGIDWLIDKNGEFIHDEFGNKIPPTQSQKEKTNSGFTTYDTSRGHCGLCGRLGCHGECFK